MRAISLWQPWATAIAIGLKSIETRSWETTYRGPIAIHAAKRWGPMQRDFASVEACLGRLPHRFPLGVIVCTARLVECFPVEELEPEAIERRYGDYSPGRFGWILRDVQALPKPIPFSGKQGFFDVPNRLLSLPVEDAQRELFAQ